MRDLKGYKYAAIPIIVLTVTSITQQVLGQKSEPKPSWDKDAAQSSQLQIEREERKREAALYILLDMAESNDCEDQAEAAHLKADIASLLCAYGERGRAVQLYRNSLFETARNILEEGDKERSKRAQLFEMVIGLSQRAAQCSPELRGILVDDLAQIHTDEGRPDLRREEPPIVADEVLGTRPSAKRELIADMLTRAAIYETRIDEAERLLGQSLNYCLSETFMTALSRLKKERPEAARHLYMKAARQLRSLPSGMETVFLSLSLKVLMGISSQERESWDRVAQPNDLVTAYLDAVRSLTSDSNSMLVSRSQDIVSLVKTATGLYARFQPTVAPQIEMWVTEATKRLPPDEQVSVEQSQQTQESTDERVSRLEAITYNAVDERERDQAFVSISSLHLDQARFDKAFETASKIVDLKIKQSMFDDIAYRRLSASIYEAKDIEQIPQAIAKISSIPMRIKLYAQFARVAAMKESLLPAEALEEAVRLTAKLDFSATQSHMLFLIADAYSDIDVIRAFEVLSEAAKSIGKHTDHPPSRWGLTVPETTRIEYDQTGRFPRTIVEDPNQYLRKPYDFSAFRKLAGIDFDQALLLAAQLKNRSLAASARYEICAMVLSEKKNTTQNRASDKHLPQ